MHRHLQRLKYFGYVLGMYAMVCAVGGIVRPLSAMQNKTEKIDEGLKIGAVRAPAKLSALTCNPTDRAIASEVAVIDFRGDIGAAFDSDAVYGLLNDITMDAHIGAILVRIDSSGGDSYVSKKLYEALKKAKACGVPMASFIENVGTSGAFWMAMAANEVHADPLSTVGAVGVIAVYKNEREKLEKEGIKATVIRTGERKWPLMPLLTVEDNDVAKVRDSLNIVLDEFVAAVEESRKDRLKLSRQQLTTGEAWMGRDASRFGLIDGADEADAVAERLLGRPPSAYRRYDLAAATAGGKAATQSEPKIAKLQ